MENNYDIQEDLACLYEYTFDVEGEQGVGSWT